ncbi:MAG: aldo/keto reductase [Eubacteriales bacterium]
MIYNGKEIKKFGFGLMRLPMFEGEIDTEQVKQMVDSFLENGFTYFDTAYGYHNQKSEGAIKECLVDRYPRDSFQLATKLPAWAGAKTKEEAEQMFYTSLERTGAGYFDFYLLHNLGGSRTELFETYDLWDFVARQKEAGLIKKLGFSMHDNAEALERILTAHPEVDFVQLQINYADWENPTVQSKLCYEVAKKHKKPVVIMEPLRGGALANPPKKVAEVLDANGEGKPYAEWGLRYAASLENAFMVLSGMSTIEQIKQNITFMKEFKPLNTEEQQVIANAQEALESIPSIACTNCQYCVKECPMTISIPDIFDAMNRYLIYGDMKGAKGAYVGVSNKGNNASACIACRRCEAVCPQYIKISDELKTVDKTL